MAKRHAQIVGQRRLHPKISAAAAHLTYLLKSGCTKVRCGHRRFPMYPGIPERHPYLRASSAYVHQLCTISQLWVWLAAYKSSQCMEMHQFFDIWQAFKYPGTYNAFNSLPNLGSSGSSKGMAECELESQQ